MARHVLDPNELEISCMIVNVQIAEPPGSRVGHMIGNRGRYISALPTGELGTEVEIRILIIQKKIVVQKADLIKHAPPILDSRSAGAKDRLETVELRSRQAQPAIKSTPCAGKAISGTV
jgi:hypothetical protein